ncbi:zf-TFIIB domain-containing protein [Arvimicrobium flavum]|uniref:TFIIB-type zinc ribbon-containing protein n=1 Tax=Arvimicrobium flavum TaxID=3393320 RepID=UPI00237A9F8D|nr:zf-TFIIB domain-containing protein [Mesorhizobium shangrilense]
MKCPVDNAELVMSERQGIEIDYCPKCRGVWLDRGELDKIIDRSAAQDAEPRRSLDYGQGRDQDRSRDRDRDHRPDRDHDYRGHHDQKRYKKKSLLGELFDFD